MNRWSVVACVTWLLYLCCYCEVKRQLLLSRGRPFGKCVVKLLLHFTSNGPDIRQDYPLNLSILISGGKETNKDSPSNGEWSGKSSSLKSLSQIYFVRRIVVYRGVVSVGAWDKFLERGQHGGWYSRLFLSGLCVRPVFFESRCLRMQRKVGGKFHLKLNIGARPIANKYREGKMKRTLKRELKSTWNCWKGTESFLVSIIYDIFHWEVCACVYYGSGFF